MDRLKQGRKQDRNTVFPRPNQKQRSGARARLFGLFAAVWVGLALQPCAIAAVSENDCPHCPPQAEQAAMPHESHHDHAAEDIPDDPPNCDSLGADCCDVDEATVNVRVDPTKVDDQPTGLPASVPTSHPDPGPCEGPGNGAEPPEPPAGSVPLHVLKCVYLD
jgi:hypothetical protein